MKKVLSIICFFLVVSEGFSQQSKDDMASKQAIDMAKMQVTMSMQELRAALLNKDSVQLERLLSDDVTYGHSNGWNQSKSELIRSVMSGEQDYQKLEPKAMNIRIHGSTAVVNFESLVALKLRGEPMEMSLDILLVWVKVNNQWKLIARQSAKNS